MADQGGKDTKGKCISWSVSGTRIKMQEILNKLLFGVGSEEKKEKNLTEPPRLLNSGDQVWILTEGAG